MSQNSEMEESISEIQGDGLTLLLVNGYTW